MKIDIERPVETERDDKLLRRDFVAHLVDALIGSDGRTTGLVVGLTGSSGSGKSSIINLAAALVEARHPETILVDFNACLIRPGNGLLHDFFAELTAAVEVRLGDPNCRHSEQLKSLAQAIFKYGKRLAPAENVWFCDGGAAAAGIDTLRQSLPGTATLRQMRAALADQLSDSGTQILVLIDEVDRLDHSNLSALAQLLRAVAGFERFSYLLAYDAERVAQTLGQGDTRRGRIILEKLVQLELPLPAIQPRQIRSVLEARFSKLVDEPSAHRQRLSQLLGILVPAVVSSLRDAKRVLAGFAMLHPVLQFEVDEVDLLGWATILSKYPDVEQVLRRRQEQIIGPANHLFGEALLDRMLIGDRPAAVDLAVKVESGSAEELWLEQGPEKLAEGPSVRPLQRLLEFLFKTPWENRKDPLNSISAPVPLAKSLSLGNLISSDDTGDVAPHPRYVVVIRELGDQDAARLTRALETADANGKLAEFLIALLGCGHRVHPRLTEGVWPLDGIWSAFSDFAERVPDLTEPPRELSNRMLAKFICGPYLLRLGAFRGFLKPNLDIMREWIADGRFALAGHLLELQMKLQWTLRQQAEAVAPFLAKDDITLMCKELARACRGALDADTLIDSIADIACLRAVLRGAPEIWDDACASRMAEMLKQPARLDRFIWYCFGETEAEAAFSAAAALLGDQRALRALISERLKHTESMPEAIRLYYQIAQTNL
jgi:energy-coupling factor transporter ATP-binding protein EcfA2